MFRSAAATKFRGVAGLGAALALAMGALAAPGCAIRADYGGTSFSCAEPPNECPEGFQCVAGTCRLDGQDATPVVDSAVGPPDAAYDAASPDAADVCDAALVVDGDPSEPVWDGGWISIAKLLSGASDGVTAELAARWSPTRLYLAWRVADSALFDDSVDPWQDDSIELYFDMDHDRTTSYGADDFQYMFPWGDGAIWEQLDRTDGIEYAWLTTADGYSGEAAIPWATLGATPELGAMYGFDAACNIDQDGGDRDAQLMWNGTADNWTDTSAFGVATLADACGITLSAM